MGVKERCCPVDGCLGRPRTRTELPLHFMRRPPSDSICTLEEGGQPLPICCQCGMHVSELALNCGHTNMLTSKKGAEFQRQCRLMDERCGSVEAVITAMGVALEKAHQFCCLGRILDKDTSDWPTSVKNLREARLNWAMIARPLIGTGVSPKTV